MLKNFFISMLGAIAGFWISMMMFVVIGFAMIIGSAASALVNSQSASSSIEKESVLVIDLDSSIDERPMPRTLQAIINDTPESQSLVNILRAINIAKDDDRIEGIYINCQGSAAGVATRQAIARALSDFRESGKWIVAYGDNYMQGDYYMISCADYIFLNPAGAVDVRGIASTIPFFKGLLDKVGVEMQVFKVGTYKSAVEPYILNNMSDANREMTQYFLNNIWGDIASTIATNRGVKVETVNMWADSLVAFDSPQKMVDLKVVNELKYADEVIEHLKGLTNVKKGKDVRMIDYATYNTLTEAPHDKKAKNKIAVYYACGDITDNGSDGIVGAKVVPDILALAEDDDIEALVLRVNSGGGSAFASEQIWHALEVFKSKGKTFYVSMGDYAASGGYYISCGAEKIYAEPATLTGSIGIFGMIPCFKELVNDKLGINFGIVSTNANSNFPSVLEPATPFQASRMQAAINRGYELFTSRCAEGRHLPQDSIKAIGEGRVWDGRTALRIGLVDELGGLDTTIDALAQKMNYKKYQVVVYPETEQTFWDIIAEMPARVQANAMRDELGSFYPVYQEVKRLENLDPIQARMLPMTVK
ncbi:MAG: signal peptide peptidase SppA [Muribaculaceae bacterium]|nr:signal peptide peptidase SppA [Muribaculaceae bacterium]